MDPNRLVSLMGHGTKKMIYETYGKYVEDFENDASRIFENFGQDFINRNFIKTYYSFLDSESFSESRECGAVTSCNNNVNWWAHGNRTRERQK
jgi:hypothetical protein